MSQDKKAVAMYNQLQTALWHVNSEPGDSANAKLIEAFINYIEHGSSNHVIKVCVKKALAGTTINDVDKFNGIVQACLDDAVLVTSDEVANTSDKVLDASMEPEIHKGFTDLPKLISVTVNGNDTIDLSNQQAALAMMKKRLDEVTAEVNKLKEAQSIEPLPNKTLYDAFVSGQHIPDSLLKALPNSLGSRIISTIAGKWNKALAAQQ